MNEDSDDYLINILKEEEQQQLQQVGGHGAQDKAQAMQVNLTTVQAHEQTIRQTKKYQEKTQRNTASSHGVHDKAQGLSSHLKLCRSADKQTVNKQSNKKMTELKGKQINEQTKYHQNDQTKYCGLTTRSKLCSNKKKAKYFTQGRYTLRKW